LTTQAIDIYSEDERGNTKMFTPPPIWTTTRPLTKDDIPTPVEVANAMGWSYQSGVTPSQAEIVFMQDILRAPDDQIASVLGISAKTVSTQAIAARSVLAKAGQGKTL